MEDDYWLLWYGVVIVFMSVFLDSQDVFNSGIYNFSYFFVNFYVFFEVIKFVICVCRYEVRFLVYFFEVFSQFFVGYLGKDGWVRDFEFVDLKDWQNCIVSDWVDEFVREL